MDKSSSCKKNLNRTLVFTWKYKVKTANLTTLNLSNGVWKASLTKLVEC